MKITIVSATRWSSESAVRSRTFEFFEKLNQKHPWLKASPGIQFRTINPKDIRVVPHKPRSKVMVVDLAWFKANVSVSGQDATVLLLDKKQAKAAGIRNATGCHYADNDIHGEIWIVADEKQQTRRKEGSRRMLVPKYEDVLEHELKHHLAWRYGVPDTLHRDEINGIPDVLWMHIEQKARQSAQNAPQTIESADAEKILMVAKLNIGFDVTPQDYVPDEVACAETVNAIVHQALGAPIGGGASTYLMHAALALSKEWKTVQQPQPGDIIISPTGHSRTPGVMPNGHVGIVLGVDPDPAMTRIGSNTSATGKFENNFSLASWKDRYERRGGYPTFFFRKK